MLATIFVSCPIQLITLFNFEISIATCLICRSFYSIYSEIRRNLFCTPTDTFTPYSTRICMSSIIRTASAVNEVDVWIRLVMLSFDCFNCSASFRTSYATTAKPFPSTSCNCFLITDTNGYLPF